MKTVVKIRIILWSCLALAVAWFLYMGIVPSGKISYINDFESENDFVQRLTPLERVGEIEAGQQKLIGNPIYFTLRTPRSFDQAKLTIRYKNDFSLPLIEVGALVDKTLWRYDLKPFENSLLNQLSTDWNQLEFDGLFLWQKEKKYSSIESFLGSTPNVEKIAVYNYDLRSSYIIQDYASSTKSTPLENFRPLKGAWQAFTYIKNETLDFDFDFEDLNKNDDEDPVDIFLYYKNQLIFSINLNDTPEERADNLFSGNLKMESLPEGVYKIEVKVNDDIIIKNIVSPQTKLAFSNHLELAKNSDEPFNLYTDSKGVSFTTIHPDRLQSISIASNTIEISETYKQFSSSIEKSSSSEKALELKFASDGVMVGGDGVFAFSKQAYFNPNIKKAILPLVPDQEGVEFVLARYQAPHQEGDWRVQSQVINLKEAYRENGKYSFLISIPGLDSERTSDYIEIDEIKVELSGRSLLDKIRNFIKKVAL